LSRKRNGGKSRYSLRTPFEKIPTSVVDEDFLYYQSLSLDDCSSSDPSSESSTDSESEDERKAEKGEEKEKEKEKEERNTDDESDSSILVEGEEDLVEEEEIEESYEAEDEGGIEEGVEEGCETFETESVEKEKEKEEKIDKQETKEQTPKRPRVWMKFLPPDKLTQRLIWWRWDRTVEKSLRNHFQRKHGLQDNSLWKKLSSGVEFFWLELFDYVHGTLLEVSPSKFWLEATKTKDDVENIATELMITASSEACCERGLSFLRQIISKRRRRLSVKKLTDCMRLKRELTD
jgi:hypothetical protein